MTSNIEDLFNLESLEPNILCDHSEDVWMAASAAQKNSKIGNFGK